MPHRELGDVRDGRAFPVPEPIAVSLPPCYAGPMADMYWQVLVMVGLVALIVAINAVSPMHDEDRRSHSLPARGDLRD